MVKTLDRYLLGYFFAAMMAVAFAIGLLIVAINMISELRSFIDNNIAFVDIARYYLYFAGWIVRSFFPIFVLLGALISIGILARRNELLAMKASGLSLYRIAAPFLVVAFLLSLGHIYYNEYIFANANKKRVEMEQFTIKGRSSRSALLLNNVYRQVDRNVFFNIATYHIDKMTGNNIKIYHSRDNKLVELISADMIQYTDRGWMLYGGQRRLFDDTAEVYSPFDSLAVPYIKDKPRDFEKPLSFTEEMSYDDLKHYIEVMKRTGGEYRRELVNLKFKFSFPFSSFIVILICVPIASNPKRGGIAISFALGFGMAMLYFVCFKVTQSLGHSGKIPPDLAAWLVNGFFLLAGIIIILRARK